VLALCLPYQTGRVVVVPSSEQVVLSFTEIRFRLEFSQVSALLTQAPKVLLRG